jgi:hydrogenase maturation protein HypF
MRGLFYPAAEVGDMDGIEMECAFRAAVDDLCALLGATPEMMACDMHPDYPSTRYALESKLPVHRVQHHHAHIASVMAEYGLTDEVIGVALDGTGYGSDGSVWGGEFLVATPGDFRRAGHFRAIDMLGGDESVKQGWKSAACATRAAGLPPADARSEVVYAALDAGLSRIRSSSAGRLFDAVSAMLGVCDYSHYDGQCAIELEHAAARCARAGERNAQALPCDVRLEAGEWIADFAPAIREIAARRTCETASQLAMGFHLAIVSAIARLCAEIGRETGIRDVALSGGVFQNRIILTEAHAALSRAGFRVYVNRRVPAGDGGISLGQAYAALWTLRQKGA